MYTMEYYSAIKKNAFESVLMRWVKLEPIIQSEVRQKEKCQYSTLTYIWNLERWWWPYMWDGKRDTDVKNSLLVSVGEGKHGMIWEGSVEMCILPHVKWITGPGLMHETGCSRLVHSDDPGGCDGEGNGRGVLNGEHMCTRGWFVSIFGKNYYSILK